MYLISKYLLVKNKTFKQIDGQISHILQHFISQFNIGISRSTVAFLIYRSFQIMMY